MLFSSILFLFRFLPITLALYYISPPKLKNTTLFLCSLVFYCWGEVKFFPIMVVVILINYLGGLCINLYDEKEKISTLPFIFSFLLLAGLGIFCFFWGEMQALAVVIAVSLVGFSVGLAIGHYKKGLAIRRLFLILSIIGSLAMLLYYKYSNFFLTNINNIFGTDLALIKNLVLPLGISFYTFQSMSYSIDVYWRRVPSEKNIINFGAYVVMFPQLIAGPIVRYADINERLHILKGRVTIDRIDEGITLFIFGLAKKVLIADNVSKLWTEIIGQVGTGGTVSGGLGLANVSTPLAWLGILAFTIQIYFDFSGYSLMGIGMGKMLGFDFPDNFNLPYISKSITEFWRRWHISLSSWFREYVYIPLGGNRKGLGRQIVNIFVVWFLTGFWHGANWNFILWGVYYGILLVIEKIWLLPKLKTGRVWPHIYTMVIVIIGWALFVGSDPGVGLGTLLNKLFVPQGGIGALYYLRNYIGPLALGVLFSSTLPQKLYNRVKGITWVRGGILGVLLVACVAYMVAGGYSPFLYFNF